jgi:hypothetical protein
VIQLPAGLGYFFLEMIPMPVQGRGAGAELPAEGLQGAGAGQGGPGRWPGGRDECRQYIWAFVTPVGGFR